MFKYQQTATGYNGPNYCCMKQRVHNKMQIMHSIKF